MEELQKSIKQKNFICKKVVGESTNYPYVIRFSEFVEHKN